MKNVLPFKDTLRNLSEQMTTGGEPPHNDDMEARVKSLEEAIKNLPTKADMTELRLANKADFAELRADLHKNSVDIQRWMIATVIGLFLGFGGLFLAMSNALKQPASAPQAALQTAQPPIIINVPSTSPSPAATPQQ